MSTRKINNDELFLDLILVANIAVFGHELRVSITWAAVEKFFLLFAAVWCVWRDAAILFNAFGSTGDLLEKLFVFLTVLMLCGIGVGAHSAFEATAAWVAACAFLAIVFIAATAALFGSREPRLRAASEPGPAGGRRSWRAVLATNYSVASALVAAGTAVPYLAAAAVGTRNRRAVVGLYWGGAVLNHLRGTLFPIVYRRVARRNAASVMPAVNIEALTEKYALLTLIVMGEALLAILFEAGTVLTLPLETISIGRLYASTLFGVALSYAFKILYQDVDNRVFKRGLHAIRWHRHAGVMWSFCHLFFHAALILSATGLGLILRAATITVPPATVAGAVVRAGGGGSVGAAAADGVAAATALQGATLSSTVRWVFTSGSFGALLVLVVLAATHKSGPRAATRRWRLPIRAAVSVGGLVGLPLAGDRLDPLALLGIVAGLISAMAVVEFILVEMDRIGWFRSELSAVAGAGGSSGGGEGGGSDSVPSGTDGGDARKADPDDPEAAGGRRAAAGASDEGSTSTSAPSDGEAAEPTDVSAGAAGASADAGAGAGEPPPGAGGGHRAETVRARGDGDNKLHFKAFAAGGGAGGCGECPF